MIVSQNKLLIDEVNKFCSKKFIHVELPAIDLQGLNRFCAGKVVEVTIILYMCSHGNSIKLVAH